MRGICQGTQNLEAPEFNDRDEIVYCYAGQGPDQCSAPDYECGLPGPRQGHKATTFIMDGSSTILLMFGGESTGFKAKSSEFSRELHAGYFNLDGVVFTHIQVQGQDEYGYPLGECTDATCPTARRDAAVAVRDNIGNSNGKLLVFGGMSGSAGASTSMLLTRFLLASLIPLDDLWYIDLDPLYEDCLKEAFWCERLTWVKVDVPGKTPSPRWGAGMVLDTSDNLYIMVSVCRGCCACCDCDRGSGGRSSDALPWAGRRHLGQGRGLLGAGRPLCVPAARPVLQEVQRNGSGTDGGGGGGRRSLLPPMYGQLRPASRWCKFRHRDLWVSAGQ